MTRREVDIIREIERTRLNLRRLEHELIVHRGEHHTLLLLPSTLDLSLTLTRHIGPTAAITFPSVLTGPTYELLRAQHALTDTDLAGLLISTGLDRISPDQRGAFSAHLRAPTQIRHKNMRPKVLTTDHHARLNDLTGPHPRGRVLGLLIHLALFGTLGEPTCPPIHHPRRLPRRRTRRAHHPHHPQRRRHAPRATQPRLARRALNAAPPGPHDPLSSRWRRAEGQLIDAHTQALTLLRTLPPSTALRGAIHAALHAETRGPHDRAEHYWQIAAREAKRLTPTARPQAASSWRRAELTGQPIRDPRARRFRS